jgi:hypothetical protein
VRLVGLEPDRTDERWGADFAFALELFAEVNTEVALPSALDMLLDNVSTGAMVVVEAGGLGEGPVLLPV